MQVPESCPKVALRAETGMMGMKHRVWQARLLNLNRIKGQNINTLNRKILDVQWAQKWPGLSREGAEICKTLGIPNIMEDQLTGAEIKSAVGEHHQGELRESLGKSKKMMQYKDDDFSNPQEYMNEKSVENTHMAFRIRCEMVPDIKGNFLDKFRRKGETLECSDCPSKDAQTQSHCCVCPSWEKLRHGLQLDRIDDMVTFFQRLLLERMKRKTGST